MPIQGRFYPSVELQEILNVSKQQIYNLATHWKWQGPIPGLYYAGDVEPYLIKRGIDPKTLPVNTHPFLLSGK